MVLHSRRLNVILECRLELLELFLRLWVEIISGPFLMTGDGLIRVAMWLDLFVLCRKANTLHIFVWCRHGGFCLDPSSELMVVDGVPFQRHRDNSKHSGSIR